MGARRPLWNGCMLTRAFTSGPPIPYSRTSANNELRCSTGTCFGRIVLMGRKIDIYCERFQTEINWGFYIKVSIFHYTNYKDNTISQWCYGNAYTANKTAFNLKWASWQNNKINHQIASTYGTAKVRYMSRIFPMDYCLNSRNLYWFIFHLLQGNHHILGSTFTNLV